MSSLEIIEHPDPRLNQTSQPVGEITREIKTLVADMLRAMYKGKGIGLSAIQVGKPLRIIVIDLGYPRQVRPLVMINPEFGKVSRKTARLEEGCLSIPGYTKEVKRPAKCNVDYTTIYGTPRKIKCEGLLAAVVQHEMDHLNGITLKDK